MSPDTTPPIPTHILRSFDPNAKKPTYRNLLAGQGQSLHKISLALGQQDPHMQYEVVPSDQLRRKQGMQELRGALNECSSHAQSGALSDLLATIDKIDPLEPIRDAASKARSWERNLSQQLLQAEEAGYSLRDLAQASGVSHETVRRLIARQRSHMNEGIVVGWKGKSAPLGSSILIYAEEGAPSMDHIFEELMEQKNKLFVLPTNGSGPPAQILSNVEPGTVVFVDHRKATKGDIYKRWSQVDSRDFWLVHLVRDQRDDQGIQPLEERVVIVGYLSDINGQVQLLKHRHGRADGKD